MTNKEILDYFEQALKDWNRPLWKRKLFGNKDTEKGLCYYFIRRHRFSISCRMDILESYWIKYKTRDVGFYDFNTREERIHAIRCVINELKWEEYKKRRSATDWLFHTLWDTPKDKLNWYTLLKRANEMHEEQIKLAYLTGIKHQLDRYASTNSEKYYRETYGKEPKEVWIAISRCPKSGTLKTSVYECGDAYMDSAIEDIIKTGVGELMGLPVIKITKVEI